MRAPTLAMVFKLAREAERSWRRLNGYQQIEEVITRVQFQDDVEVRGAAERKARMIRPNPCEQHLRILPFTEASYGGE